jgi:hypothetical protein
VKQPDLLPTAPHKPIPGNAQPAPQTVTDPAPQPVKEPEVLPTAPPKPIPASPPAPEPPVKQPEPAIDQPVPTRQPELLPTAPHKPIPAHAEPAPQPVRETEQVQQPAPPVEVLPTAPHKPIPSNAEPAPQNESNNDSAPAGTRKRGSVGGGAETPLGFNNNGTPAPSAGVPVLVLRKTPCLGPCPHFEASIYADGRVQYVGHRHVAKVGTYELRLPEETVREMLRQADEIGFSSLQDQYLSGVTDMPSTFLTYNRRGQPGKTVQVEGNGPDELRGLLTYINNQVDSVSGGSKAEF